ncbi:bifunctional 4-hydroxy-2-oxoglutarate aldolase/2-dehydro-3-deoxy-phosphogluconate aldolase [Waterburya agarophytonicola K14]|uniref:Bifunctional 4-hydroxy-2-oxoglutarate aldolase/2-dehydro-3-deoxy-phosphogluconate aldolase n=1 Tax=Waterburya agarophytonicola KI4 TaxID=2874699 RepID=A0A964BQF9_9CYAN|nr:bifunctional 4-hydroxy-2-oxoglutarate aldolase/2-dehydro-3-deoxy-phosphogluconate aldolase [Waterburya agarophytonicola]MCC0177708.1 bifunctional 4-hydroxy-2-oxoglutarate aldolase/2-dehydro-3-deoxy-phosphogluconate aldolase [Waterburya agarophytonicola KI4]
MTTDEWLQILQQHKAIAVIRCADLDCGYKMARAVAAGGMSLIEIAWNSDRPEELVTRLRADLPHCIIGAGTILNLDPLQEAVSAGSQFAFAPNFNPNLLDAATNHHQIPFVPGVFSPTEIVNAWQHGAKVVKVFPIELLGGAEYIQCLQAPLGHIPLIPTGGITIDNARMAIDAGAIAVGISSNLFPAKAIAKKDWSTITARAYYLLEQLSK